MTLLMYVCINIYIFFIYQLIICEHRPEILPGTWQKWMYCMYLRSSYVTDIMPLIAPYNLFLYGIYQRLAIDRRGTPAVLCLSWLERF
jgi:hypothetical protein